MFHNKFVELIYVLEELEWEYSVTNSWVKVKARGNIHEFSKYDEKYIDHLFAYIDEL